MSQRSGTRFQWWFAVVLLWCLPGSCLFGETLEGRVVEDHTSESLASGRVRVRPVGAARLIADLDTDSRGLFHAQGLPPGDYYLEISKPNFVGSKLQIRLPAAPASLPALSIRLVRLGVVAGQVVDERYQPIRRASVYALVKRDSGDDLRPLDRVVTDDRGQYRLNGLFPGEYAVAVSLARYPDTAGAGALLYPNNVEPRFFSVSGGEEYQADFALPATQRFQVSGTVEQPEPDVTFAVSLASVEQPALQVATRRTEPDGSFKIDGVPPGSYHLFASGPARGYGAGFAVLGEEPLFGRTRIDVAGSDLEGITVVVGEGHPARFTLGSDTGDRPAGCPASAALTVRPLENWGARVEQRGEVGFGAEQTVAHLAPGRHYLELSKLGETCFQASDPVVDLESGYDAATVLVTAAGAIRGRLVGDAANSSGLVVVLTPSEARGQGPPIRIAYPDAEFLFEFAGLKPGRYRIAARPAGEASQPRWIPDVARMVEIDVLGGAPTELDLPVSPMYSR